MDFTFTEEQEELRRTVRAFLRARLPMPQVRAVMAGDTGQHPAVWQQLAGELGLTALAVDERYGGFGAGFVEVAVVLEETGRALCPLPYLSTVTAAAVVEAVADAGTAADLLPGLAEGAVLATLAVAEGGSWSGESPGTRVNRDGDGYVVTGGKDHVLDGQTADLLVVTASDEDGEPGLYAVSATAAGVHREVHTTLDQTRRQAGVRFDAAPATRLTTPGTGRAAVERALDLVSVALALESVGAARQCLETTVEYLRTRVQFGRPIGAFQALKHRCADLAVLVESASSTAYYAAWATAADSADRSVVAPLAKAYCADAFLQVAGEMIQLHGGIGFTWEHEAHLYFKRAKSTELLFGNPRQLRQTVGARAGI